MARSLEDIQNNIILDVQAQPELAGLTSTSRRALWRMWTFVQASAILLLEQIIDVFKAENEAKIATAIPGTFGWLTDRVFQFQYSATNPQFVVFNNFAPSYPVIDESLQIITRCAVISTISNKVQIKTAKSEPPQALTSGELTALQSYINTIGVAGITYTCMSTNPDRIWFDIDVFYDGQYSAVIANSVSASIDTYFSQLPFNGAVKVSDLEFAIRNTTGVNDVLIKNLKSRQATDAFTAGTYIVQNQQTISRLFNPVAGYVIQEDTVTNNINLIAY